MLHYENVVISSMLRKLKSFLISETDQNFVRKLYSTEIKKNEIMMNTMKI